MFLQVRGKKVLVLDPKLSGPLALVAQPSLLKVWKIFIPQSFFLWLKELSTMPSIYNWCFACLSLQENGVENLYHLSADPVASECKNVIYLMRPRMGLMKLISSQIQQDNIQKLQKNYTVVFLPRRTIICEKVSTFSQPPI